MLEGTTTVEELLLYTEQPEATPVIWREFRNGWTPETVFAVWGAFFPAALLLSLLCLVGVMYSIVRVWQIRQAEWASFRKVQQTIVAEDVSATQLRWRRVLEHAQSSDEHKWRLAILEADIMLNELLDLQGYKGETMAEKMKQVPRTQFNTIDDAWEAHRVRNRVAHEGSEMHLSEREKNHVMNLFERVFNEFGFI